jgi:hypothetical protein
MHAWLSAARNGDDVFCLRLVCLEQRSGVYRNVSLLVCVECARHANVPVTRVSARSVDALARRDEAATLLPQGVQGLRLRRRAFAATMSCA